jgi:hypothetical protein
MDKSILEMLTMSKEEPDATNVALEPLDVFGEKSQDADTAVEYGFSLPPEEIMNIAMSVTPMGRAKAGKGVISFLKELLGKAKSKRKFPIGEHKPSQIVLREQESPINVLEALKELHAKPKGIRQVGKFNRQLQRKNYK